MLYSDNVTIKVENWCQTDVTVPEEKITEKRKWALKPQREVIEKLWRI